MAVCPELTTGDAFLSGLLLHIDCKAETLGGAGYQALASPSSFLSVAVTGLLVVFVALFGLRMMMGRTPSVRDSVMAMVKIGVVLTLAGSWPAYKTLVYDVIVEGPEQIARALGGASDTSLIARLQTTDRSIITLTNLGTGREPAATLPSPSGEQQRFPIADDPAFGWARIVFLTGVVAVFAVVRLTAGLLLALTPLFAGLLLFGLSRGLVIGWARALIFTFLASVASTLIWGVQLALLEPWLTRVVTLRQSSALAASAPVEILVLNLGFAIAIFGALAILLRLSFMTSWHGLGRASHPWNPSVGEAAVIAPPGHETRWTPQPAAAPGLGAPSRALAIADAVRSTERREGQALAARGSTSTPALVQSTSGSGTTNDSFAIPPSGQALRRTKPRTSLAAALRDRRS
ncbi:type IV secretion system protein [uncultured Brevundimonas sp.]|uniref:type IV secretion system protein n=1 Tax=uncultured Brevundimonas sp. TaxID=213418 RepID=UPI0025E525AC|nr:type IV secretion system protein [uncultured Brevundimonas sp.]